MRIILLGAGTTRLGAALAAHLHLDHLGRPDDIVHDAFVLEGWPRDLSEAQALDAILRKRAAEVDVVLWLRQEPQRWGPVLDHYRGRVVEVDGGGDELATALDGLREALLIG